MTVHEVALRWRVSTRYVQRLIQTEALPATHFGPKLVRVRKSDVEAFEAQLKEEGSR